MTSEGGGWFCSVFQRDEHCALVPTAAIKSSNIVDKMAKFLVISVNNIESHKIAYLAGLAVIASDRGVSL